MRSPLTKEQKRCLAKCPLAEVGFVEPMLLKPVNALPTGKDWLYEIKWDGFRCLAIKNGTDAELWSRNRKSLAKRFPRILEALRQLPLDTIALDGEIVYLTAEGKPSFESLQNAQGRGRDGSVFFFVFDLLNLDGRSLTALPLRERKDLLAGIIDSSGIIRPSETFDSDPADLMTAVRSSGLEGVVAKHASSPYEPAKRSGKWVKFKTYQSAEFVIGGFLLSQEDDLAILVGIPDGNDLIYAAKVMVYLKPKQQRDAIELFRKIKIETCPFSHVPRKTSGDTWSVGITKEELLQCVWLQPTVTAEVEFIERTRAGLLRHARFRGFVG